MAEPASCVDVALVNALIYDIPEWWSLSITQRDWLRDYLDSLIRQAVPCGDEWSMSSARETELEELVGVLLEEHETAKAMRIGGLQGLESEWVDAIEAVETALSQQHTTGGE